MSNKLFSALVPIEKNGWDKGDLLECIRAIHMYAGYGKLCISMSSVVAYPMHWQSMQLVFVGSFDQSCANDPVVFELSLRKVIPKQDAPFPESMRKIIASYPHIPGTTDFTPYISAYIEAYNNGGVEVEYEMRFDHCEEQTDLGADKGCIGCRGDGIGDCGAVLKSKKDQSGNPIFKITRKEQSEPVTTEPVKWATDDDIRAAWDAMSDYYSVPNSPDFDEWLSDYKQSHLSDTNV